MTNVTKAKAQRVLEAVKTRYPEYASITQPLLFPGSHEGMSDDSWVISWEEGPYEWAYNFTSGGVDEEVFELAQAAGLNGPRARELAATEAAPAIEGVFLEPVNTFTLGVYAD